MRTRRGAAAFHHPAHVRRDGGTRGCAGLAALSLGDRRTSRRPAGNPAFGAAHRQIGSCGIGRRLGVGGRKAPTSCKRPKRPRPALSIMAVSMGKEIEVAILFADVVGSTKLYEQLGDLRARDMVGICIEVMRAATDQNHGTVIKTMGDEVMSTFP